MSKREFPRLVYMSPSAHIGVSNEAEYAAALAAGYFNSVPEAAEKKHAEGSEPVKVAPAPAPAAVKPVKVFKGDEVQEVPDQATADALITGDGWYKTADEAKAAAKKK